MVTNNDVAIEALQVSAYRIPIDAPESGGNLEWDAIGMVMVEARMGGRTGVGGAPATLCRPPDP